MRRKGQAHGGKSSSLGSFYPDGSLRLVCGGPRLCTSPSASPTSNPQAILEMQNLHCAFSSENMPRISRRSSASPTKPNIKNGPFQPLSRPVGISCPNAMTPKTLPNTRTFPSDTKWERYLVQRPNNQTNSQNPYSPKTPPTPPTDTSAHHRSATPGPYPRPPLYPSPSPFHTPSASASSSSDSYCSAPDAHPVRSPTA